MSQAVMTEDQRDCLQELINVAMGQASNKLARFLDTFIELKVPDIDVTDSEDLNNSLIDRHTETEPLSLISQGFTGADAISGEALLIYQNVNASKVADLLGEEEGDATREEHLTDISSILTTTFLQGFSEQLESKLTYSAPRMIALSSQNLSSHLASELNFGWNYALQVKIVYQVTEQSFNCEMMLLFPEQSFSKLLTQLDIILEEY